MGSFLGMLQYPLSISMLIPQRSYCPTCEYQLKWYENIPVFSYLFLKGKCKNCHEIISKNYPIIELVTMIITLLLYLKLGLEFDFIVLLLLSYGLILLSFIDLHYKAVPDYLLVFILICSFFYSEFYFLYCFVFAGIGILLEFFVTFYIQNIKAKMTKNEALKTQKALGEGDIPVFAMIGGMLGLELGIIALFLSAVLALIPSLLSHFIKKENELPFIPFLTLGFFLVFFFEKYIFVLLEKGNLT
jgi:leader peptidase (prepilin peptidase)/N-methyltransferase